MNIPELFLFWHSDSFGVCISDALSDSVRSIFYFAFFEICLEGFYEGFRIYGACTYACEKWARMDSTKPDGRMVKSSVRGGMKNAVSRMQSETHWQIAKNRRRERRFMSH